MKLFHDFRTRYLEADIRMAYEKYVLLIFLLPITILSFGGAIVYYLIKFYEISSFFLFFPLLFSVSILLFLIIHPYDKRRSRKLNIDFNLPYAISYMASISETGVAPLAMFESIADFDEYEEVSKEAANIVKQAKFLGKDLLTVLQAQADKTPSESFKAILKGMISVFSAGGDISAYLRQKYNEIMFQKLLKESEYEDSLAIHENIFTILLIIAPLFFFIFIIIGETLNPGSIDVILLLRLLTFIFLPIANIFFILLLKLTRTG